MKSYEDQRRAYYAQQSEDCELQPDSQYSGGGGGGGGPVAGSKSRVRYQKTIRLYRRCGSWSIIFYLGQLLLLGLICAAILTPSLLAYYFTAEGSPIVITEQYGMVYHCKRVIDTSSGSVFSTLCGWSLPSVTWMVVPFGITIASGALTLVEILSLSFWFIRLRCDPARKISPNVHKHYLMFLVAALLVAANLLLPLSFNMLSNPPGSRYQLPTYWTISYSWCCLAAAAALSVIMLFMRSHDPRDRVLRAEEEAVSTEMYTPNQPGSRAPRPILMTTVKPEHEEDPKFALLADAASQQPVYANNRRKSHQVDSDQSNLVRATSSASVRPVLIYQGDVPSDNLVIVEMPQPAVQQQSTKAGYMNLIGEQRRKSLMIAEEHDYDELHPNMSGKGIVNVTDYSAMDSRAHRVNIPERSESRNSVATYSMDLSLADSPAGSRHRQQRRYSVDVSDLQAGSGASGNAGGSGATADRFLYESAEERGPFGDIGAARPLSEARPSIVFPIAEKRRGSYTSMDDGSLDRQRHVLQLSAQDEAARNELARLSRAPSASSVRSVSQIMAAIIDEKRADDDGGSVNPVWSTMGHRATAEESGVSLIDRRRASSESSGLMAFKRRQSLQQETPIL